MVSNVRVELDFKSIGMLVEPLVRETVDAVRSRAGEGYQVSVSQGKTRPHGMVWAETAEAKRDNEKRNTLLKALYAGGGGGG